MPNGWTDWMESIQVMPSSAQAVGINVQPAFPDYARTEQDPDRQRSTSPSTNAQISNTPWTYYNYLFRLPIPTAAGRELRSLHNEEAWELVQQLDHTPSTTPRA